MFVVKKLTKINKIGVVVGIYFILNALNNVGNTAKVLETVFVKKN
jgi:hypothetical protein